MKKLLLPAILIVAFLISSCTKELPSLLTTNMDKPIELISASNPNNNTALSVSPNEDQKNLIAYQLHEYTNEKLHVTIFNTMETPYTLVANKVLDKGQVETINGVFEFSISEIESLSNVLSNEELDALMRVINHAQTQSYPSPSSPDAPLEYIEETLDGILSGNPQEVVKGCVAIYERRSKAQDSVNKKCNGQLSECTLIGGVDCGCLWEDFGCICVGEFEC